MTLVLILCALSWSVELLLWMPRLWSLRKQWSAASTIITAMISGVILALNFSSWQWLFAVLSGYRVFNIVRVYEARLQPDYLFHSARRASLWLVGAQVLLMAGVLISARAPVSTYHLGVMVSLMSIAGGCVTLGSVWRHYKTTRPPLLETGIAHRDLPSLTVAIPARNETEELAACLQSLIESDYPKLEILVLDDCSQDRNTPEIIRSFAHDGVRFVAGSPPPERWLAKNYAYEQLAREANGKLLLFCGVDTRFETQSLTMLVQTMLQKHKTMLSVLPINELPTDHRFRTTMIQTGRYAWELALPRRWLRRPPVLSTCWLIDRATLRAAGGFEAACRTIVPERYLAKYAAEHDDGYSFLVADAQLSVRTAKVYAEQQATSLRTRYPSLHRCPERVTAVSLAELIVLLSPLYVLAWSLLASQWFLAILATTAYLLSLATYAIVATITYRRFVLRSLWLLPAAAIYDIALLQYSMWCYEFSQVIWKGRNICVPVMRVVPRLPRV